MLQSHDCDGDLDQGKDCVDVVKFYEPIFHAAVIIIFFSKKKRISY